MPIQILPESGHIGRRDFLAGLAGGAALLASPRAQAADDADWFALLSDTHVAADPETARNGHVMATNLRRAVGEILANPTRPRGVFVDGDLALLDGRDGDYGTFLGLLDPLRASGLPIHLALGNHDDRDACRRVAGARIAGPGSVTDKAVAAVDSPHLRFVVLDSLDTVNVAAGKLGKAQLGWLSAELDSHGDAPTLIVVHHNVTTAGPPSLLDVAALLDLVRPRPHVKAIAFGHTHAWGITALDGIHLINLPAVGYPFAKERPIGWCRLRPKAGGAEIELRCIGEVKDGHAKVTELVWR